MRLKAKFLLPFLFVIPLLFLFYAYRVISEDFSLQEKELFRAADALTKLQANGLVPYLDNANKERFVELLSNFRSYSYFIKAVLYDAEGNEMASYEKDKTSLEIPIHEKALFGVEAHLHDLHKSTVKRLGTLKTTFTLRDVHKHKNDQWVFAIGSCILLVMTLTALMLTVLNCVVLKPLKEMRHSLKHTCQGDLNKEFEEDSADEIGIISSELNQFRKRLKSTLEELYLAIKQTAEAYNDIVNAAKLQESAVIEQESGTKEIAVTIKEISATTKDLAHTMKQVNKNAEETSLLALSGKTGLNQMVAIMQKMVESTNSTVNNLALLNEKANNIKSVIVTISKVADQTNLLSLNSAIEAEIAGEYGKTFGVIAREIRRLADQTAYASLDISNIVNEMTSAVSSNVSIVDTFSKDIKSSANQLTEIISEELAKIIERVQQQKESIESVTFGMHSQMQAAEQISEAVFEWGESSQETRRSILKFNKTIDQLSISTQQLKATIGKFST